MASESPARPRSANSDPSRENCGLVTDRETGLLFPAGDSHALAVCLEELLRDSALRARLATAGAERIRIEFTLARPAERMGEIYAQVLTRAATS